ncbi:MAG: hypothetical protein IPJ30_12985 [Acidobacteria bacterium]|nr:hypothetical protein [Acidobacteriota bacterium]
MVTRAVDVFSVLSETDQTGRKLKTFVPANGTTLAEQELVTIGIRQ